MQWQTDVPIYFPWLNTLKLQRILCEWPCVGTLTGILQWICIFSDRPLGADRSDTKNKDRPRAWAEKGDFGGENLNFYSQKQGNTNI